MTNFHCHLLNLWAAAAVIILAVYFIGRAFCDKVMNNDIRKILRGTEKLEIESDLTKFLIHEKKNH